MLPFIYPNGAGFTESLDGWRTKDTLTAVRMKEESAAATASALGSF